MNRRTFLNASRALAWPLCLAACRPEPPSVAADSAALERKRAAEAPAATVPSDSGIPSVAPPLPTAPAADWKVYRGDGFELRYPPDATIAPDTSHPGGLAGIGIHGRRVSLRSPNENIGTHTGPAFALIVSSFANPASRSVGEWVDSVRRENNARIAPDDADSLTFLAAPDTLIVAGHRALMLHPFCGDCQPEEVYVAGPGRMLVVSTLYDLSIPGDHHTQARLYDAIMSTLRWTP